MPERTRFNTPRDTKVTAGESQHVRGIWEGHTRELVIRQDGVGRESENVGCCTRDYQLTFRILSVRGTLTGATAAYRVTAFRQRFHDVKPVHLGEVGRLRLENGKVTNTLTRDYFCSGPRAPDCGA